MSDKIKLIEVDGDLYVRVVDINTQMTLMAEEYEKAENEEPEKYKAIQFKMAARALRGFRDILAGVIPDEPKTPVGRKRFSGR